MNLPLEGNWEIIRFGEKVDRYSVGRKKVMTCTRQRWNLIMSHI